MNTMFGIENIKIKKFDNTYDANDFIQKHNGNIIDIQCKTTIDHGCRFNRIFVVYQEK